MASSGALAYTAFTSPDTSFNPAKQPVGYVAQDDITDFNVTSNAETLYRPEYDQQFWSGNLHAYPVDTALGSNILDMANERWAGGAAQQIATQYTSGARYIATMDGNGVGQAFTNTTVGSSVASGNVTINGAAYTSAQIIAYLRGDQSLEAGGTAGGQMRARNGILGDIIHSRPYYFEDVDYPTVFVGANDGMLHAIDAGSGQERWAYIPSILLPKLQNLAYSPLDSAQLFQHNYYVDGQINIGPIRNGADQLLVGGLGAGGQGLYALTVTSLNATSDATAASKARWEISNASVKPSTGANASTWYTHLGYTYGQPQLVKVMINGNTTPTDVVIIGNGLNPTENSGNAYLYVIDANTGAQIAEVRALSSYAGTSGITSGVNGIFNPVCISTANNGIVDRVYAGDLNGTVWRFNLSAAVAPGSWTATAIFSTNQATHANTPTNPSQQVANPSQPITSTIAVGAHPNGGYMLNFGTGSTLYGSYGTYNHTTGAWNASPNAPTGEMGNNATHYVYGIWDGAPPNNSTLVTQTLTERNFVNGSVTTRVRRATANAMNWSSGGNKGWQVALPIPGERVVGEGSFIESGRFYFNSYNPYVAPMLIANTNTDIYGENWLMELNYLTGGSENAPFMDMDGNMLIDSNDRIKYDLTDPASSIPSGSGSGSPIVSPNENGIPVGKMISIGVQSQPLLIQLSTLNTTLLNQNPDVIFPTIPNTTLGVANGHFDVDFFNFNNWSNSGGGGGGGGGSTAYPCSTLNGNTGSFATPGTVTFGLSGSFKVTSISITVNGEALTLPALVNGTNYKNSTLASALVGGFSAHYAITSANSGTMTISATSPGAASGNIVAILVVGSTTYNSATGTYLKSTSLSGGSAGSALSTQSGSTCTVTLHKHEYDKLYGIGTGLTGLNMLQPNEPGFKLSNAIVNPGTQFKVLVMNQYLNPAMRINLADKATTKYTNTSWNGYVALPNFQTSGTTPIDPATLPTYTMATIGSLALNMPVDAFAQKNWWGGTGAQTDVRVGVMPTSPACAYSGQADVTGQNTSPIGTLNATLYTPVIPPTSVTTPANGNGTLGSNTGVRHNGAVTVQIIAANTPASAIEFNDPAGTAAYGSRVNAANFFKYVLAEYVIYWHHPSRVCFGDNATTWYNGSTGGNRFGSSASGPWNSDPTQMVGTGWTKLAHPDTTQPGKITTANVADPQTGSLNITGASSGTASGVPSTVVSGNVTTTTIRYADGSIVVIVTTIQSNGSSTVQTTNTSADGATTTTSTTVANAAGSNKLGGDESGSTSSTRRISWRELFKP